MSSEQFSMGVCNLCKSPLHLKITNFGYCPECKVIFNLSYQKTEYEDSYFDKEYKEQYGKSYLEDKANIQKKMRHRLEQFLRFSKNCSGKNLLEIGSAAGFFLELALKKNIDAQGWEISRVMADYANKNGFKTLQGDFLSLISNADKETYDIVAAFYVMEHFPDQKRIWEGLSRIIKSGGFLLLALPSISGPSYWFHREKWIKEHPPDHYIDFSISGIKKVSSMFGFKFLHIAAEGIHPERFPLGNWLILKNIYKFIQEKLGIGDTFFVILRKIN